MLEKARETIEKYALGKRVAAAVSGGEDSMALLALLHEYAACGALELLCVNVEHGIRKESAAESEFVRDRCLKLGVEFECRKVDIPLRCARTGRGVECEAHFARREYFSELVESGRADIVATAHHARDNVETVLLHLFRGCGLKGLAGMQEFSAETRLLRPFISTAKEEICAYLQSKGISHVTDGSNFDTDYDRNFIRHEILPKIKERFPAAERAILRTAAVAAEAARSTEENLCEEAFCERDGGVSVEEEYISAPYVFEALRRLNKTSDVYGVTVESVLKLLDCKPCARVDLGDGFVAAREYGKITFFRTDKKLGSSDEKLFEISGDREISLEGGTLSLRRATEPYFPAPRGSLVFDADKLPQGAVLRHRREGDFFTPYGGGRRKLKEYLIDKKIPLRLRDSLWLVCKGSEVLAVIGVEISDGLKVDSLSARVYRAEWVKE